MAFSPLGDAFGVGYVKVPPLLDKHLSRRASPDLECHAKIHARCVLCVVVCANPPPLPVVPPLQRYREYYVLMSSAKDTEWSALGPRFTHTPQASNLHLTTAPLTP